EIAVGMSDVGPRYAQHARVSAQRAFCELGELSVVARRQILTDLPDLLFDQMVIIEQPLRGRLYTPAAFELRCTRPISRQQRCGVIVQSLPQRPHALRPCCHCLRRSKATRVLPQPLGSE